MNDAAGRAASAGGAATSSVALRLAGISRRFRQGEAWLEVLRGVDLELAPGAVIALMGPSGSGKSTLLQIAGLLDDVAADDELSVARTLAVGLAVLVTCLVLRPVWMIPFTLFANRRAEDHVDRRDRLRGALVGSWAGMRGVVSLAAAFGVPLTTLSGAPFPGRPHIVFLTFVVVIGTLLLHGLTLPWLILGLVVYPALLGAAWFYAHNAERVERDFVDLLDDP